MKRFLALSLSDVVFIMLINIVGILTFLSRMNFVPSLVEHGKSFKTSEPGSVLVNAKEPPQKRFTVL